MPPQRRFGSLLLPMLYYASIFLLITLIAGVLGFGVIAGTAANIAKSLFLIFLVLSIISYFRGRKPGST